MTRLLMIGVAGMDWAGFDARTSSRSGPGSATEALPELSGLRARGVAGWLAGAPPSDGPAAWASIVTGVQPEIHGVWRWQEAWPGGVRHISKASWRVPPLWSRLAGAGLTAGSVAWPASRPGADWGGLHIDDRFPQSTSKTVEDWALPRCCVPEDFREALRHRRVHVTQIKGEMVAPLVADLSATRPLEDDAVTISALALAQAATVQSGAMWLLEQARPDAVFIHHPWLGQMRRAFESAMPAAWRFLDGLVGSLAAAAGPEALILLVSPGWGSRPGVVLAAGAGVTRSDDAFPGCGLLDIVPTALARFGLEDVGLPGGRLAQIAAVEPLTPAPSPPIEAPAKPDPLMLRALRKHRYRPPPMPGGSWKAEGLGELAFMMLERDPAAAGRVARVALLHDGANILALRAKVRAHVVLGEAEPLPELGNVLITVAPDRGWGPLAHGAYHVLRGEMALATPWLLRAETDPDVTTLVTVAGLWLAASRHGAVERVSKAVLAKDPLNVSAEIGLAIARMGRRDFMAAELGLQRAMKQDPGRPAIYLQLAQVYARTARKAEAARCAGVAVRMGVAPALTAAARAGRLPN